MEHWIKEYQRACPGAQVAYNPVGSGAGVNQFLREAKAFGGTDGALKPDEVERSRDICRGGRGIDLPMLGGPIAIGYNLSGVDDLVLDAPTLARIFDSEIKEWDDPAIRELNPGTDLPDLPIQAVHRSDDSGTTQNFMAYLSGAAPEQWPYEGSKTWQGKGGHSADGSDNVASEVSSDHGAIGYFELSFATSLDIPTVEVDTGAPEPVAPSPKTASAGIATAQVVGKGKDLSLELDYSTTKSGAYPIVLVTYEVVCDKGNPAATLAVLKSFLTYTHAATKARRFSRAFSTRLCRKPSPPGFARSSAPCPDRSGGRGRRPRAIAYQSRRSSAISRAASRAGRPTPMRVAEAGPVQSP